LEKRENQQPKKGKGKKRRAGFVDAPKGEREGSIAPGRRRGNKSVSLVKGGGFMDDGEIKFPKGASSRCGIRKKGSTQPLSKRGEEDSNLPT